MNLVDTIQEEIRNDDADTTKQSAILEDLYKQASESERRAIDDAIICLCGWSLSTLLDRVSP